MQIPKKKYIHDERQSSHIYSYSSQSFYRLFIARLVMKHQTVLNRVIQKIRPTSSSLDKKIKIMIADITEEIKKKKIKAVEEIEKGKTARESDTRMKASKEYEDMQKQRGKVEQVMEVIRLAKIRATLTDKEMPLS